MVVWRYCQSTVPYGTQPTSGDEADDARVVTPIAGQIDHPAEDWEKEVTIVPGQSKRRVVYGESHSNEPTTKRVKVRDIQEAHQSDVGHHHTMVSAYYTHFHLDRMSKMILGDNSLTVQSVVTEQLERPPFIPVCLEGGVLIYCDPETYPMNMPIDTKWKGAVGMHPKRVAKCSEAQVKQLFDLIKNPRVSAIGEVGLETSLRDGTRRVHEDILREVLQHLIPKTPLILHIRSTKPDRYSKWLYLCTLGILK